MKKRIIWIGLAVVIITAVAISLAGGKAIEVEMGTVEKGDIEQYVEEKAVVRLENESPLYAVEGGKVLEVPAKVGETVKAGDVLVKLDDTEIRLQIEALEAQKQNIEAQYAEIKKPSNEEIRKLEAQVRSAEVSYSEAKRVMESSKKLYELGSVSFDIYQKSSAGFSSAEANLEVAKSNLAMALKGASANVQKQYQSQLTEIQSRIELLNKKKNDYSLKSPIDGMILTKKIEIGSMVLPGALLAEIGSDKGIFLESDILVDEISDIRQGAAVLISNEDLGIKNIKGSVRKIYPKASSKISELGIEQKRVKIEVDFSGNAAGLKSGYDMNIKIITASKTNSVLVDRKAVFEYQGKDHVFVNVSGLAKLRAIEKGLESDEKVEVLKGLNEGEKVILSPGKNINEGAKVK